MQARVESWGRAPDGTPVDCVTLASPSGVTAVLLSWGATLARLEVPDRAGARADVVLGFDTSPSTNPAAHPHFGGIVGRCANRIAGARFTLDGRSHLLTANEGRHHLHGGARGFDRRVWGGERLPAGGWRGRRFESPDGEEGYPGRVSSASARVPDLRRGRARASRSRATSDRGDHRLAHAARLLESRGPPGEPRAGSRARDRRGFLPAGGSRADPPPARSRPSRKPRSTSADPGPCARRCAMHRKAWITIWC